MKRENNVGQLQKLFDTLTDNKQLSHFFVTENRIILLYSESERRFKMRRKNARKARLTSYVFIDLVLVPQCPFL